MNILLVSYWFPLPAENGSQVRLWNLAKRLARHHRLTLVAFTHDLVDEKIMAQARTVFSDVCPVLMPDYNPTFKERLRGWFSTKPCSVVMFESEEMQQAIRWCSRGADFDLAIAWELGSAPFVLSLRRIPRFLEGLEASYALPKGSINPRVLLRRWKYRTYMRSLARQFDGLGTVSYNETLMLKRILGPDAPALGTFANGVDLDNLPWQSPQGGTDMIYYGSLSYEANRDAVDFMCSDILPRIVKQVPNARLVVTGRVEERWIPESARHPNVIFTGFLEDPRPAMTGSAVSVVPLRIGGGTRLKVLEAMALGTPVVGTSVGLEGLGLESGREVLLADAPAELADAVITVLTDSAKAVALSRAARERVEQDYNWDRIAGNLDLFLEGLVRREQVALNPVRKERVVS